MTSTIRGTAHGSAKGMSKDIGLSIDGLDNSPSLKDVKLDGKPFSEDMLKKVLSASVDMGVSRITEIAFTFDDPEFRLLSSDKFSLKTRIEYRGLHLHVAALETNAGAGLGGFVARCRPVAVHKLKGLTGSRVLRNVTPAAYVKAECKKAEIARLPMVQASSERKRIKRDVAESGVQYEPSQKPSAWTTMQRLAGEEGFLLYEIGGAIFFGKPTWLVDNQPKVELEWYPENDKEPYSIPEFRETVDSKDIELPSLKLPIKRAGRVFPGMGLKVTGFPKYSDLYFINSVSYPLVGRGDLTVTAGKVINPTPTPKATSRTKVGGSSTWDGEIVGDWVPDADKRGANCAFTPKEMVARAHNWIGVNQYSRHCEAWIDVIGKGRTGGASCPVEEWGYMPAGTPHEVGGGNHAPAGSVVIWRHNSIGHIAMAIGGGMMITTNNAGPISLTRIEGYINYTPDWKYPNLA